MVLKPSPGRRGARDQSRRRALTSLLSPNAAPQQLSRCGGVKDANGVSASQQSSPLERRRHGARASDGERHRLVPPPHNSANESTSWTPKHGKIRT